MQDPILAQQEILRRRLPVVILVMLIASVFLIFRLVSFQQLSLEVVTELNFLRDSSYSQTLRLASGRGRIFDRDGQPLAVNTLDYRIGISPNLVSDPRRVATQLSSVLSLDELETFEVVSSNQAWALLAPRVSAELGQQVEFLDLVGVTIERIPRRSYPQGTLAAQIVGFVSGDLQGYNGVEGFYQDQLTGQVRDQTVSNIPFDIADDPNLNDGKDLVLTLDRELQFLAESELLRSITETGATSGTIIVMNPRNGDVLALANHPTFDPNNYFDIGDPNLLVNPAISEQYEPGSVMKILTVAGALERGVISPQWTYNDQGRIDIGGVTILNADQAAHGLTDTTQVLAQSLNVGAATVSLAMGPEEFYRMFDAFGIGRPTGIDLQGEQAGILSVPGDSNWSESQLGTNAFGQGVAVTPLQMLTAVSAIANDGLMMQPRVVYQIIDGDQVFTAQPSALGRPISAETAQTVSEMLVTTVRDGQANAAALPGYTIAGKTGTAEIPTPIGYENNAWIMTFVGYLPADDPQVAVLIKLDRPNGRWASQIVAPIFSRFAERLVLFMEIPTDDIRLALAAEGGQVGR